MPTMLIRSLIVTALALAGCGEQAPEPAAVPPKAASKPATTAVHLIQPPQAVRDRVRTEPVTVRSLPDLVTAPGEVALDLRQVAKITSRIDGQIEQVHVQLGDRVKPGQPLAAIGSLQLDQLIEEYLVGKAQADVAENSFHRTEKLRADDIVPERKLVEDRGRYLETNARYQHIREKLLHMGLSQAELSQLERGRHDESHRYILTTPIAGTVVAQNAVRGQGVAPGNELFEVVDTSRVWVFANLPIEQARKFKEGDVGTIVPKGGDPVMAPLVYVAPVADEVTRTIHVKFDVTNREHGLKPREYVDVQLSAAGPPVTAIPVSAVTMVGAVRGVFVQRDGGFVFTPVEVGRESGGWTEVRKGVAPETRVAVDGVFDLKNVLLKEQIGSGEGG